MRNRTPFKLFIVLLLTLVGILGFGGLANAAVCVPQDAVETTYKTVLNPEYVPAVEEESHVEIVVVEEPWSETVLDTPEQRIDHPAIPATVTVYPPVVVPAVTHVVNHPATYKTITHPEIFHVEYQYIQWVTGNIKWRDTPTWNGHPSDHDWGWFYTGNSRIVIDEPAWSEEVVDVPAWDEIVIDVPEYTIPGYEVTNDDAVEAWTEIIPATYVVVDHPAVTREQLVIDVEAQDAIGEEYITVVDVQGTDAVTCPVVVEETPTPTETVTPVVEVINAVPAAQGEVKTASTERLAATGSTWDRVAPYALGFIMLGIVGLVTSVLGRRYDKRHHQQLF